MLSNNVPIYHNAQQVWQSLIGRGLTRMRDRKERRKERHSLVALCAYRGLPVKHHHSVGHVSRHDEIVLHDKRRLLRMQNEPGDRRLHCINGELQKNDCSSVLLQCRSSIRYH